jgi:DNA-binding LacI/PurR family transcriptional regulator
MVLLLIPEWPISPAIAKLVEELTLALAAAGLTLVVHAHPRSARPVHDLWKAITPAAVINHQALDEAEVATARRAGIPVVAPVFQLAGRASFADFQQGIGRAQAEQLAAAGHRRLGYALPDDERLAAFAEPRLAGVRAACADLELAEPVAHTVPLEAAGASAAVRAWRRGRVTAVCAYNDEVALAVLAGLRTRRLTAPGDLAVIGVDDIPAGALADPALTTIATGMSTLGQHLAAAVMAVLRGEPVPPGPGSEIIRLVRRDSA